MLYIIIGWILLNIAVGSFILWVEEVDIDDMVKMLILLNSFIIGLAFILEGTKVL